MRFLWFVVLCGCAEAPLPTHLLAPPTTGGIELSVDALYAGETNFVEVHGAYPGETVYLLRSRLGEGAGRCYDFLGGGCFDLLPPIQLQASALADGDGVALLELPVPGVFGGRTYGLQAVVIHGLSGADTVFSHPTTLTTQPRDDDNDGTPNALDPCPQDPLDDADADGACDSDDPCPLDATDSCEALDCKAILDAGNSTGSGVYTIDPDGNGPGLAFDVYCDMETDGGGWTQCGDIQETPGFGGHTCVTETPDAIDAPLLVNASFCAWFFDQRPTEALLVDNQTAGATYGEDHQVLVRWGSNPMELYTYDDHPIEECTNLTTGVTHSECQYSAHASQPFQSSAFSFTVGGLDNNYSGNADRRLILGPTYHASQSSHVECRWYSFGADQNTANIGNSWLAGTADGALYLR